MVTRDSLFSKTQADSELTKIRKEVIENKTSRERILGQKRAKLREISRATPFEKGSDSKTAHFSNVQQQGSVMRARQNKAAKEKKEIELQKKIKQRDSINEVFGATDPKKIQEMMEDRKSKKLEIEKSIDEMKQQTASLTKICNDLKKQHEQILFAYSKGVGSNRMIAEGKALHKDKQKKLAKLERQIEALDTQRHTLVTGINTFPQLLQLVTQPDEAIPNNPSEVVEWTISKVKVMKDAVDHEDSVDLMAILNKQVLLANFKKQEEANGIEPRDSIKKSNVKKSIEKYSRQPRDTKGEPPSRVLSRQQVKNQAVVALNQREEDKKKPTAFSTFHKK